MTINASFKDCIDRIIHCNDTSTPDWLKHKTIYADSDTPKDDIKKMFDDCISFNLYNDEIEFVVPRPKAEIQVYLNYQKICLDYQLRKLRNWADKDDKWKAQIEEHLKSRKLNWILDTY